MARFQNGWLRKKHRKSGEVWLFCYRQRRQEDGKWVEATPFRVGSLKEFPSEETAWRRVEELRLNPNQSTFGVRPLARGSPSVDPTRKNHRSGAVRSADPI
jgi:hypothetical protein